MLSPAKWNASVPRDRLENLEFRLFVLRKAKNNRAMQLALIDACKNDLLFFVCVFVWQVNPKKKGAEARPGPFISFPFQDPAFLWILSHIERGRDCLLEKSRQMGASWMIIIVFVWLFLFHGWQTLLFISRNEKAVEDESPNSLFWKIDFILRHLPNWMKPPAKKFKRRKLFYGNDQTNSSIFGEASTGQANVGGNTTAMGIDEYSQIKEDYEVLHRTSDSTNCRIFNGTHLGLDTAFYELSTRVDMDKLVLHWSQHPDYSPGLYRMNLGTGQVEVLDKTYEYPLDFQFVMDGSPTGGPFPGLRSPWYDEQCRRKGSKRAVSMDLDIDPAGSDRQFFDQILIRDLIANYCRKPLWQGDVRLDRDLGRVIELVPRVDGPLKLWINLDSRNLPPGGSYGAGADVSYGLGATPSCLSMMDAEIGKKVMEYVNPNIEPKEFAELCVALCWLFKTSENLGALFAWEKQGPGNIFSRRVVELGYRRIYYKRNEHQLAPNDTDFPGWYPSPDNRDDAIEEYAAALRTRQLINPSERALKECLAIRWNDRGHLEHSAEYDKTDPAKSMVSHSDILVADYLAWMMTRRLNVPVVERRKQENIPPLSLAWRMQRWENERREEEQYAG